MEEKPVSKAVIQAGIVSSSTIKQMTQWGMLPPEASQMKPVKTADVAIQAIREVVESDAAVEMRESDLDAIKGYMKDRQKGKLHLPLPDGSGKTSAIVVEFSTNRFGEYLLPWNSDSIADLMTHEEAFLKPAGGAKVQFADVRELYYGDHKAFMVCTPRKAGK